MADIGISSQRVAQPAGGEQALPLEGPTLGQLAQTHFRDKGLVRENILEEVTSGGQEHMIRQSRRQGWCRKRGLP